MLMPSKITQPFPSAPPEFLRLKDDAVNYNVHPALSWAEPFLAYAFAKHGKAVVVTCAKDGVHSEHSRHFWKPGDSRPAQAVDLRILDSQTGAPWFSPAVLKALVEELAHVLNFLASLSKRGHYTILVESNHIHLEWNQTGVPANVRGYTTGREVYGL